MNIYRANQVPKRLQTPEGLANEAWHFANTLSAGRWGQKRITRVQNIQSIVETVGSDRVLGEEEIDPINTELELSFLAFKHHIGGNRIASYYKVGSQTTQNIHTKEIPTYVLGEIIEDGKKREDHPLFDFIETLTREDQEITAGDIDTYEIKRSQNVLYHFNHEGAIEDYTLDYGYSIDDMSVYEAEFTYSEEEMLWQPQSLNLGLVTKPAPTNETPIYGESLRAELENLDKDFEIFMVDKNLVELDEFTVLPQKEHIRRILGMISMHSSSFVDLRKR